MISIDNLDYLINIANILTEEEYKESLNFLNINIFKKEENTFTNINIDLFDKPNTKILIKFFELLRNKKLKIKIQPLYLFDSFEIAKLINEFLLDLGNNYKNIITDSSVSANIPDILIAVKNPQYRSLLNQKIDLINEFLSFILDLSWININVKIGEIELNNKNIILRVLSVEKLNPFNINQTDLSVLCSDYKNHFYKLVLDTKNKKIPIPTAGWWYSISFDLSKEKLSFIDGKIENIQESSPPEEFISIDNENHKIYPLSIFTKMSAFDALSTLPEIFNKAIEAKHNYLGLVDFNSVQSFAEAEELSNKHNIQVLYGSTFEVISKDYRIIDKEINIDNFSFAILDIETTGLNPIVDDIIEIAIIKYKNGAILKEWQAYIKTDKKINPFITELTTIDNDLLEKNGISIDLALEKIKEIIQDDILVAHNGINFDKAFINAQYLKRNLTPLNNPILDTMRMSQSLYFEKKYKSHSLQALSKKLNISYDEAKAHSALYDTQILCLVFQSMSNNLMDLYKIDLYKKDQLNQLNQLFIDKPLWSYKHGDHVVVYSKNQKGIKTLYKLISKAHIDNLIKKPILTFEDIDKDRENIIIVSATIFSELLNYVCFFQKEKFLKKAIWYDFAFIPPVSHFKHEISKQNMSETEVEYILQTFIDWCKEAKVKILLNYAVKYIYSLNQEAFRVMVNAKGIAGKPHYLSSYKNNDLPDYFYKTTKQLKEEFLFLKEYSEVINISIKNQEEFINSFEKVIIIKKQFHTLDNQFPNVLENITKEIDKKLLITYGKTPNTYILDKINYELERLTTNKYLAVYWISHLLVKKSIEDGYLVGSRGSVGSSFVAFLLNISQINPLPPHYYCSKCSYFDLKNSFIDSGFDLESNKPCPVCNDETILKMDGHNIPFETFLGLKGDKIPDIDLNFSSKYQSEAHNYLQELIGPTHAFRSGTINTIAKKTSIALVLDYFENNNNNNNTYRKGKLEVLSHQIIDCKRTTGQHPGGILAIPQGYDIYDFTPLNYSANDIKSLSVTTHLETELLTGTLFKFDILGHDDPTFLWHLYKLTNVDPNTINYQDSKILSLFSSLEAMKISSNDILGETVGTIGLPEFGTPLTRGILRVCQPKSFADLIRISGISHGTHVWKSNIHDLVAKDNFSLKDVICCRDDIMIYLQSKGISLDIAFNITESIRKGKGINNQYLKLLMSHNIPNWYIKSANKISYIFPKAHATAYVIMSWKIAYYKLNHPLEFYSTYFTLNNDAFDLEILSTNDKEKIIEKYLEYKKIVNSKQKTTNKNKFKFLMMIYEVALEMLSRNIKFENIDINKSDNYYFLPIKETNTIRIPFTAMEGLGEVLGKKLIESRNTEGDFKNKEDFFSRIPINTKVLDQFKKLNILF